MRDIISPRPGFVNVSPDAFTPTQWEAMKAQCNYTCLCCGRKEPDIKLVADHVIPKSKGGQNIASNIQPLCVSCNARKATKNTDYR